MAVTIFLPEAGVRFVVVGFLHRPVSARPLNQTLLFVYSKATAKVASVVFLRLKQVVFLYPVAMDRDG